MVLGGQAVYICIYLHTCIVLSICFGLTNGREMVKRLADRKQPFTYTRNTIYVDQSGHGNFSTIQSAIDSIPSNNKDWICVDIKAGEYREQVTIPVDKPFIYLKGDGKWRTIVTWDAHDSISTSPTLIAGADNLVAKSISFKNSYNNPPTIFNPIRTAPAALIAGNKSAFYRCGFFGFQDTLWDVQGHHYFKLCTIQGAVDFIFGAGQSIYEGAVVFMSGAGQSIYERCTISVIAGALNGLAGFITAQGRSSPEETNGFVFKECRVLGDGITLLGRPWRPYARVIFYNSSLSQIVLPEGWSAWGNIEDRLTFAEHDCYGEGSNRWKRVKWEAKLSQSMLSWFTSIAFVDGEGWINTLPFNMLT